MSGVRTLRLPQVDTHWGSFDCDTYDPPDVLGYLTQYARRLTAYAGMLEAIQRVEVWHPQATGFPADLTGRGEMAYSSPLRVLLTGTYDVPDCLAHGLGHIAHFWLQVAATGTDQAGADAWRCWRDAGGYLEDWANDFGAYLIGQTQSPYFRWLPVVLGHWRRRAGWIAAGSAIRADNIWQWTDIERGRLERFVDGRWLARINETWQEFQP
jgi:hypothetical protein